jgi:hypothetical protein
MRKVEGRDAVSSQSRTRSAIEAVANVVVGYGLAVLSQMVIYRLLEIPVAIGVQLLIGAWFTVVSVVRTYVVRRCFNRWREK